MARSKATTTWLVGDIGGTNARFGLVSPDGTLLHSRVLADADYPGIGEAIDAYLAQRGGLPLPAARGDRDRLGDHRRRGADDQPSLDLLDRRAAPAPALSSGWR